jgi:hypothetical protein
VQTGFTHLCSRGTEGGAVVLGGSCLKAGEWSTIAAVARREAFARTADSQSLVWRSGTRKLTEEAQGNAIGVHLQNVSAICDQRLLKRNQH